MTRTLVHQDSSLPHVATANRSSPRFYSMSELLEVAIADARSLDARLYAPNYVVLHEAHAHTQCQVCLAGSLVAGTLSATPDQTFSPSDFPDDTANHLESLNEMRRGQWVFAYHRFYDRWPHSRIEDRLRKLPKPSNPDFDDWPAFHCHLDSLESSLPELRSIELSIHWL